MSKVSFFAYRFIFIFIFSLFGSFFFNFTPVYAVKIEQKQTIGQKQLVKAISSFRELCNDKEKSAFRDQWARIINLFSNIVANNQGDTKLTAQYYVARTYQELAKHSMNSFDAKLATENFQKTANLNRKHKLAVVSLLAAAKLYSSNLRDIPMAKKILFAVIKDYPKSQEASQAKKLLSSLESAKNTPNVSAAQQKMYSRAKQLGLTVKTVLIDAGHGGKDPGAESNNLVEKDITLFMAKLLGKNLAQKGFDVRYTRFGDTYKSLTERTEMANKQKVDLFISIHCNASLDKSVHGLETYYLDSATSSSAAKVAARENSVAIKEISDVQFILADLMLNSKLKESRILANKVHSGILKQTKKSKIFLYNNGVRPAPFYVLVGAKMPAVLVELGYLTNQKDAEKLRSTSILNSQAEGIVDGILRYKESISAKILD